MSDDEYSSDSTDGGVVEESLPISLELKRSRLLQSNSVKQEVDKPAPGKLAKWQPTSTRWVTSIAFIVNFCLGLATVREI